ncbi:hypothetical protein [Actinoplanes sp. DH11]|nr:hypothetical protein [Actinoplanes sp. DH11]
MADRDPVACGPADLFQQGRESAGREQLVTTGGRHQVGGEPGAAGSS